MSEAGLIRQLETRSVNAWPALKTALFDGWVVRAANGLTKRANSACAFEPEGDFAATRAEVEAFYDRHDLPAMFRLTPLAPPGADRVLEAAGYDGMDAARVQTLPLDGVATAALPGLHIDDVPTNAWLAGIADANGYAPALRETHKAMLDAIAFPAAFATFHRDDMPVGFGFAVHERGMIGLYDIVIVPGQRGGGLGRTLVSGLLAWGRGQGAGSAYLQVMDNNPAARRLYAGLGFTDAYRYHYRTAKRR